MKHLITTLLLTAGAFFCSATEKPDTIHAADFGATIAINPSNTIVDNRRPVHYGISITGNRFFTAGRPVLKAKSTANLSFTGNTVSDNPSPEFILDGCRNISITGNNMAAPKLIETNCAKVRVK